MGFDSLLRNETFVDVTLACSTSYPGGPIPAIKCHKVVLAACSPYFEALLRGTPCQHPVIVLKDVRYEDLKPLVEFMYKGQVNVLQVSTRYMRFFFSSLSSLHYSILKTFLTSEVNHRNPFLESFCIT